jgi:regulator of ribonuclease activity A
MKTADLVDAHNDDVRFCNLPFLKFGLVRTFWGPIVTVRCFEDNALLKRTIEEEGKGRILVVDGGASTRMAVLGDMIAAIAIKNNWKGIVLNAAIRDTVEIDEMRIGVFCLASSPKKSSKEGTGKRDVVVSFGGVDFLPDDYIYCDPDGVLVSRKNLVD